MEATFTGNTVVVHFKENPANAAESYYQVEYQCGVSSIYHFIKEDEYESVGSDQMRVYKDILTLDEHSTAGLTRNPTVRLTTVDANNVESDPLEVDLNNPPPPAPVITYDISHEWLTLRFLPSSDADFVGYRVWVDTSPNVAKTTENERHNGPDSNVNIKVDPSTTYYIRYLAYDAFGEDGAEEIEIEVTSDGDPSIAADTIPPAMPTGLTFTGELVSQASGEQLAQFTAAWTQNTEDDFATYDLAIREGSGNWVSFVVGQAESGTTVRHTFTARLGTTYSAKVRAVDTWGNRSPFTAVATASAVTDTTPPAAPTALDTSAAFQNIWFEWVSPADSDLSHCEVHVGPNSTFANATYAGSVAVSPGEKCVYQSGPYESGSTRYFWVRAVDTSGNAGPFAGPVSATTAKVEAVEISGVLTNAQIESLAASKISGQLTDSQIAAVAAAKLTGKITNTQIDTVATSKLTGQLTDAQIAAISAAKLTGSITSTQIADDAITTPKLATGAVTANEIKAGTITADELASNSITTPKLAAGSVTTNALATDAVTANKIASGTITANELASNSITTPKIAAGAVTTNEIAAGTIVAENIASDAITTPKLAAGAVTTAELAAGSVNADKIAASAVTVDKIAANAVNTSKLAAGAVTTEKMTANSINGDRIQAGTLDASKVKAGSVLAGSVVVSGTNQPLSDAYTSSTWAGTSGKPDDTDLLNTFTQGAVTVINQPQGGTFSQAVSSVQGSIKIKLPVSWTSTMLRFYVEVYNYSTDTSFTLEVGGYNYSGGPSWYNNYARMTGSAAAEKPVRFGHDGDTCCIYIGDATTTWAYPQVTVSNVRAGYSNYSLNTWKSGWSISIDDAGPQNISGTQFLNPLTGSNWTNVSGTGKPDDNATVGAPNGTNVGNQTAANVAAWSANPAARVNAASTAIDPGKITVSGSTTLADWRMGGDLTKIDGGAVSANTITANKLSVGNRGLMIRDIEFYVEGNTLKWTTGLIFYNRDTDNAGTYGNVPAGSQAGSGSTYYYVYWTLPSNQAANTSTPLQVTTTWTAAIAANAVCLATWRAGTATVVAHYGGTIIDGSKIVTGTIDADRLTANTVLGQNFYVGGTNVGLIGSYGGAGKGSFVVKSGSTEILKAGYLNGSSIGFELRNASNQVLLSSSTNPSTILNSSVTLSSLGYTGATNANYVTNTSQLTDGAGLGTKATWTNVTGTGKPQNNATVGAAFGVNISGQITSSNVSTYIANAAIKDAQIASLNANKITATSLSAITGTIGTLRTASSGARMEIKDNVIKVYDANGVVRVQLGNLSL